MQGAVDRQPQLAASPDRSCAPRPFEIGRPVGLNQPFQRVLADVGTVREAVKAKLKRENRPLNPAAIQRQVQALCAELLTLTMAKRGTKPQPAIRAKSNDSTNQPRRAS